MSSAWRSTDRRYLGETTMALRPDEKLATPEPTTHDLNRRASREWIYITLRDATVSYPRPLTLDAVVDGGWNDRDGN